MKKKLIVMLLLISGLCLSIPKVYGNSAAPIIGDEGSGIFFDVNQDIRISKEVLNIKLDGYTAQIEAIYTLENTSSQPINDLKTFFISPINESYGSDFSRDFIVKQDDYQLRVDYYYYASDNYSKENWEDIIIENFTSKYQIVDPTDIYYLYTFNVPTDLSVNINKDDIIFNLNDTNITATLDTITFTPGNQYSILSSKEFQEFEFFYYTPALLNDYLFYFYRDQYISHTSDINYAASKANNSLYNLSKDTAKMIADEETPTILYCNQYYESYSYTSNIVQAVAYDLNFEANETSTVSVKYNYLLSHSFGYVRSGSSFLYYLSPAKYWQSFQDLTINLTLDEKYTILRNPSLEFTYIDGNTYQYKSNTLPDVELSFTVAEPLFSSGNRVVLLVIIIILALFAIAILVTTIMLVRLVIVGRKKYKPKVK